MDLVVKTGDDLFWCPNKRLDGVDCGATASCLRPCFSPFPNRTFPSAVSSRIIGTPLPSA